MGASLSAVTLTGADDLVDPRELRDISREHNIAEWGILLDPARMGAPRYPHTDWIGGFLKECASPHKALHLCGAAVHGFIAGEEKLLAVARRFNRVQLNIEQKRDPVEAGPLDAAIRMFGRPVILPYNPHNAALVREITAPNRQIIFDSSGGQGKLADEWPAPLPGLTCAYAGGLSAENLKYELPRILKIAPGHRISIDMESSLFDASQRFDTRRARDTLQTVARLTK